MCFSEVVNGDRDIGASHLIIVDTNRTLECRGDFTWGRIDADGRSALSDVLSVASVPVFDGSTRTASRTNTTTVAIPRNIFSESSLDQDETE